MNAHRRKGMVSIAICDLNPTEKPAMKAPATNHARVRDSSSRLSSAIASAASASQAAVSPARSDKGRAPLNQKSGLHTMRSVAMAARRSATARSSPVCNRRRNAKNSSGRSPEASGAPHGETADVRGRDSGG